jgi:plastocyanin
MANKNINVIKMKMLVLALGILILLSGCIDLGGEVPEEEEEAAPAPEPVARTPSFTIVSPDEGEVITTETDYGSIDVALSTSDLIIKPEGSAPNKVGEGHFAISVDDGDTLHIFSKTYILEGVEPGSHTLRVELLHNDHTSYSPPTVKTVNFYVEKVSTEYVPKDYTVTIHDFNYEPETITVNVGDRVTWVNEGSYPRSATYTGVFDTEVISPGNSATVAMKTAGTFEYYSLTHMAMKGTVVVEEVG